MCGIVGIVGVEAADRAARLRRMRDLIVHRGPDSAGERLDPHAALGIRRLRVIDLVTGDQPVSNEDRSVWVVFNGELYDYERSREALIRAGHRLSTRSDTETIVHLYEDHGARFAEHIDGMFAIAVWDERTRTLVLARDRMGKKPLLYAERSGELVFASEHAALLAGLPEKPEADPAALRLYLRLGYVPAPFDAFRGVRKLLPGHVLVWRDGVVTTSAFWTLPEPGTERIGATEAIVEIRRLVKAAVRRRLVADVPVGAFLSGGVDSSAVVATMAELTDRVRTFTVDFAEAAYSEAAHARRIADLFGTEHHEFRVEPHALEVLPTLVRHYGEPYADSSAIPTYYLSKVTREHVTVALNGDGGDEVFAGYDRYLAARLAAKLDVLPGALRGPLLRGVASLVPDSLSPRAGSRRLRRFLLAAALPREERYLRWVGIFDREALAALLEPEFDALTASSEAALLDRRGDAHDPVTAAQLHDFAHYLPDDLLAKVDIASMANSLEVRSPLLDRELVEFVIRLPATLRLPGSQRKFLLKQAFAGVIPDENMYRRKQGFAVPVGEWFRGELRGLLQDTLLSSQALSRGILRRRVVERLVGDHVGGRADHALKLWTLLMLELWHREFVDGSAEGRAH